MLRYWLDLIIDVASFAGMISIGLLFVGLLILWCTRGFSGLAEFYRYVRGKDK